MFSTAQIDKNRMNHFINSQVIFVKNLKMKQQPEILIHDHDPKVSNIEDFKDGNELHLEDSLEKPIVGNHRSSPRSKYISGWTENVGIVSGSRRDRLDSD